MLAPDFSPRRVFGDLWYVAAVSMIVVLLPLIMVGSSRLADVVRRHRPAPGVFHAAGGVCARGWDHGLGVLLWVALAFLLLLVLGWHLWRI